MQNEYASDMNGVYGTKRKDDNPNGMANDTMNNMFACLELEFPGPMGRVGQGVEVEARQAEAYLRYATGVQGGRIWIVASANNRDKGTPGDAHHCPVLCYVTHMYSLIQVQVQQCTAGHNIVDVVFESSETQLGKQRRLQQGRPSRRQFNEILQQVESGWTRNNKRDYNLVISQSVT